jgi:molybdopterin-containing oxidoreductase family membrane subunit
LARQGEGRRLTRAASELRVAGDLAAITSQISQIVERPASRPWLLTFALVAGLSLVLMASLVHLVSNGIGVWGNNQNVAWAWDITGFVFWIGIGHAGTLISAVLFLFRQKWRTSVSRAAEAITLFAVLTAAIYPLFHMGRVWLAYWLFPIPTQMGVWPNFKSPLVWDVFAISSYFIVSVLFWYMGMVPDLATLRDRAQAGLRKRWLNWLSLGWVGSQRHYVHYEAAYLLLAGLATPLVISVHTVVSFDFAVSITPGWHNTLFPPYFVAGAVFCGSAVVVALMIFVRRALGLEKHITMRPMEAMKKIVLVTGCMLAYSYAVEFFLAARGSDVYETTAVLGRFAGPYAGLCWLMLGCNALLPQLYWFKRVRTSVPAMLAISLLISVGMWLERFVIIVTSQHRSFLPATWSDFHPTFADVTTFLGSLGMFLTLFVLFLRFAPCISMSEVKVLVTGADENDEPEDAAVEPSEQAQPRTSVLRFKSKTGLLGHPDHAVETNDWATMMGEYSDPSALLVACRRLSKVENVVVDARAPYPLRAARCALDIGRSPLPYFALVSGALGGSMAFAFQFWAESINYPNVMGGKAPGAWQAYVPITFEVTVLSAALGCFLGLWYLCGLPASKNTTSQPSRLCSATDGGYCLVVEIQRHQKQEVVSLLRSSGAVHVEEVA